VKTSGSCVAIILLLAGAAFGQGRGSSNPAPVFQGTFGNVVFPGGTAGDPGVQRFFPTVGFPAGNPPRIYTPGAVTDPTRIGAQFGRGNRGFGPPNGPGVFGNGGYGNGGRRSGTGVVVVPYYVPIYVGGYAGYSGYYDGAPPDGGAGPAPGGNQPNVIVVYPPASAPQVFGGGYGDSAAIAPPAPPAPPQPAASDQQTSPFVPASYYLIAYKDHTIYSAVAYWVEGDTLHYFTTGATHNQVSLGLVDRDLTQRLNEEAGNNLQLPGN